ncbi:ribonuclease H-like domain-containing protein [Tanacetum coccineum]
MSMHPMVTRAKAGIFKPLELMNCYVTTTSPLIGSHVHALQDSNWKEAMLDEYNALITNETWVLVPRPANVNVVRSIWLFKHEFHAYDSLSRYKARLVANEQSQQLALLQCIIGSLHGDFAMTDLGSINYFFGISAQRTASSLFLSQSKFTEEILERAHMQHCNPCKTHVDTESKIIPDGDLVADPILYRSLVGALQYLTFTRPDLSYVVQQVCIYIHDPREPHLLALKRILRYVRGTLDHGLQLHASSMTHLIAYTDVDCAEVEYRGVPNVVAKTAWISNLLRESHTPLFTATLVYSDNIDIHFVLDFVASGQVRILHVPSRFQYADMFTKVLSTALFLESRFSLNVRRPPAQTAKVY